MALRLIVNADDFGITKEVNSGILLSMAEGIVTSTTIMVNMPGTAQAIQFWSYDSGMRVGLHFNITTGRPLSPLSDIPTLVDKNGCFHQLKTLITLLAGGAVSLEEIALEFRAQLNYLLDRGLRPTHIDSHKHLHLFPDVLNVVLEESIDAGIGALRYCAKPPGELFRLQGVNIEGLSSNPPMEKIEAGGIFVPDGIIGLDSVGKLGPEALTTIINDLPDDGVYELMCHPGYPCNELRAISSLTDGRKNDLEGLTSPMVRKAILEKGIILIDFHELRGN